MKLIALDTSTEQCSAALWHDGLAGTREALRARGHGELILSMIHELLREAGLRLNQLDAVAVGRGPGAFTGVRLGLGVAQGLAFSAQVPLLPVSGLRAVAAQALAGRDGTRVLVCQDARMDEVYWGPFVQRAGRLEGAGAEQVGAPHSVRLPSEWGEQLDVAAGTGFEMYEVLQQTWAPRVSTLLPTLRPHAREIALLAAQDGLAAAVAPEAAQPVYLRDQVAALPSSN